MAKSNSKLFYCIYTGANWNNDQRSKEHIVPYALGGSNKFVTHDVSKKGNNEAGDSVDSLLVNNFFMVYERWKRGLASAKGEVPSLVFSGKTDLGRETETRLTIDMDGEVDLWTKPYVVKTGTTVEIGCTPEEFPKILANLEKKHGKVTPVSPPVEQVFEQPEMRAEFSLRHDQFAPGIIKIGLAYAHIHLGKMWAMSSEGARLRTVLKQARVGSVNWDALKLHGFVWPEGQNSTMQSIMSRGEDSHTLMLLNTGDSVCFYVLLFGKYEAGFVVSRYPKSYLTSEAQTGFVTVIDTAKRDVRHTTFSDFVAERRARTN